VGAALSRHVATAGYLAGWRLVRLLPERSARALFDRAALRFHARDGAAVRQLRSNLQRVRPELDAEALDDLTREGVRSYLRHWCESSRRPCGPTDDLVARTRTVHEEP